MNPKKFGKIADHKQEPWKTPLPVFIEGLYFNRFGKSRPDNVNSIEETIKIQDRKKAEKRRRKQMKRQENKKVAGEKDMNPH